MGSRSSPVKTGICPAVSPLCIPTFPSIPSMSLYQLQLGWQAITYIPRKKGKTERKKEEETGIKVESCSQPPRLIFPMSVDLSSRGAAGNHAVGTPAKPHSGGFGLWLSIGDSIIQGSSPTKSCPPGPMPGFGEDALIF